WVGESSSCLRLSRKAHVRLIVELDADILLSTNRKFLCRNTRRCAIAARPNADRVLQTVNSLTTIPVPANIVGFSDWLDDRTSRDNGSGKETQSRACSLRPWRSRRPDCIERRRDSARQLCETILPPPPHPLSGHLCPRRMPPRIFPGIWHRPFPLERGFRPPACGPPRSVERAVERQRHSTGTEA